MSAIESLQQQVASYIEMGWKLVPVPAGNKGPRHAGWNIEQNCIGEIEQAHRLTENVGLAHAYSGTCAVDVDDLEGTLSWFRARGISFQRFLDAVAAVKISSGRTNRAKLLYRSDRVRVTRQVKSEDGRMLFELRCASSTGMTFQDLLPPSIHPDTGKSYEWDGDWRNLPALPPEIAAVWDERDNGAMKRAPALPSNPPEGGATVIQEGGRNATFTSLAGSMRRRGFEVEAIDAALQAHNTKHCVPPLPMDEVRKIAESVARYQPDPLAAAPKHTREQLETMIEATEDFDELTVRIPHRVYASELRPAEVDRLIKRIAKKAGVPPRTLNPSAIGMADGLDDGKSDHMVYVRRVLESVGSENILFVGDRFWRWTGEGVWRRVDDRELKRAIHDACPEVAWTAGMVASVLDLLKTEAHRPNHTFDVVADLINCENGTLVLEDGAWVLQPHKREHYCTSKIAVAYDSEAKAPRFAIFLEEVFQGDSDAEQKIAVVEEAFGYSLMRDCRFNKCFMLHGGGANGKSVLLRVIQDLVGMQNVCAVQPNKLDDRFQRSHLQGKLVNIVTEIAAGAVIADAQLKALVSGELTTVEHKNKDPFDFSSYATFWLGTNHLPDTKDFSDALRNRIVILEFNQTFGDDRRDPDLGRKLREELPGILILALRGLKRLFAQGAFTECPSSERALQEWRLDADQVKQFIADECEVAPDHRESSSMMYSSYQTWFLVQGPGGGRLSHNKFSRRLKSCGFRLDRDNKGGVVHGVRVRPQGQGDSPRFHLVKVSDETTKGVHASAPNQPMSV